MRSFVMGFAFSRKRIVVQIGESCLLFIKERHHKMNVYKKNITHPQSRFTSYRIFRIQIMFSFKDAKALYQWLCLSVSHVRFVFMDNFAANDEVSDRMICQYLEISFLIFQIYHILTVAPSGQQSLVFSISTLFMIF